MGNRLAVYQADQVVLLVCEIPIEDGRDPDEFVSIEKDEPDFEDESGSDGMVCRAAVNDRMHTVKVTLLGASRENQVLSALRALDVNTPGGAGIGGFLLKDTKGASLFAGAQCWIHKMPTGGFGRKRGKVVWEFRVIATPETMILGGN
jgi:hypothetical protein